MTRNNVPDVRPAIVAEVAALEEEAYQRGWRDAVEAILEEATLLGRPRQPVPDLPEVGWTPERRRQHSERMKEAWTEERRRQHSERQKASWERRRGASGGTPSAQPPAEGEPTHD